MAHPFDQTRMRTECNDGTNSVIPGRRYYSFLEIERAVVRNGRNRWSDLAYAGHDMLWDY